MNLPHSSCFPEVSALLLAHTGLPVICWVTWSLEEELCSNSSHQTHPKILPPNILEGIIVSAQTWCPITGLPWIERLSDEGQYEFRREVHSKRLRSCSVISEMQPFDKDLCVTSRCWVACQAINNSPCCLSCSFALRHVLYLLAILMKKSLSRWLAIPFPGVFSAMKAVEKVENGVQGWDLGLTCSVTCSSHFNTTLFYFHLWKRNSKLIPALYLTPKINQCLKSVFELFDTKASVPYCH